MALPLITLRIDNDMFGLPATGNLTYQYLPFQNLQNPEPDDDANSLIDLRLNGTFANINLTEPLILDSEVSYDDSVNLIVSDRENPVKIINSRFYQTSTMTYEIADRKGNLDTNIYSEQNFVTESSLIKSVRTITQVDFLGIQDGGMMKVGNYTFYFKLADADGNETDFIAESGKVICHIGGVNYPKAIRGGQQDENSNKIIKFKLRNLDLAYDYINIYYTRSTGDSNINITKTYKISDKYKITNSDVSITITGYENHEEIDINDINVQYSTFDSVKSLANCQGITFAGNISNDYNLFKILEKYSLHITPEIDFDSLGIGNLNYSYEELYPAYGFEYYNINNVYYKLGYWDEEIYRMGIVYILNNYTLSPVFNIRGKKQISENTTYKNFSLSDAINYNDDYIIQGSDLSNPENCKGVFKIDSTIKAMFNSNESIKPLGIRFKFRNNVIDGDSSTFQGLKDLTKGFFFVRQKRIPTILAQGIGIGTSKLAKIPTLKLTASKYNIFNSYAGESFLSQTSKGIPMLKSSLFEITNVDSNALLCPEASNRIELFNSFFNSSEYVLGNWKYASSTTSFLTYDGGKNFTNKFLIPSNKPQTFKKVELTLIEPGVELIRNNNFSFSSKAGDAIIAHKHLDPVLGNYEDPESAIHEQWNTTATKVRGEFNTFIGTNDNTLTHGTYYNIFQKNYDYPTQWKNYFRIRYNDSSPFYPVSDRTNWNQVSTRYEIVDELLKSIKASDLLFRGDCYINTYTHRMNWNFIDPEMPTNKKIIDPYTWSKNFKVKNKASTVINETTGSPPITKSTTLVYNKLLPLFTYKDVNEPDAWNAAGDAIYDTVLQGLIEPDGKKFKKYSEINGLFGTEKINKPDVNAVPLGHWVTFKICSNINLAMRDLDWTRPEEESIHKQKRGFYPLQALDPSNPLPESNVINSGISKTTGDKYYYEIPDVPFIKTNFSTRIYYSNFLQESVFSNGNRVFETKNYRDYTREYGSLIKLVEWYGRLIAVMEHGIMMIPVNERAMMTNESGENVYINTDNVLPKNPKVLSNTFGSIWPESIVKTSRFIYGIDTVGKKIWRTDGEEFECISDMKIQKFLNDHINLKESDKDRTINVNFIKSHYNAFKQDILFVFKYNDITWNLCWNELTQKWVTQYTWFPEFSENINNIFYTFANQSLHTSATNCLFKHGFAGTEEEFGDIKPTYWYDQQLPFEFEIIVKDGPGIQKIFDNLKIISNMVEPNALFFEIVGEGFNWFPYKDLVYKLNDVTIPKINNVAVPTTTAALRNEVFVKSRYTAYLSTVTTLHKLPYIYLESVDVSAASSFYRDRGTVTVPFTQASVKDLTLVRNNKTKENLVLTYQKGLNIKNYGRMRGNMDYLEDAWNVQIQPISFPYAYVQQVAGTPPTWELLFTNVVDMKIRDKYLKVRVQYSGTQYVIIHALQTMFTISYS